MGGGASAMQGVEELITTTYMIGRAIAAVTFPGMFRIYDFHSPLAPKLKNAQRTFSFFAADSDDEEDDNDITNSYGESPDPALYEHFFSVKVGEDTIYLEDPCYVNDAGWSALHACCMSYLTVPAGISLIEEMIRRGSSLDGKTLAGPGTFNKDWTPLQMACAYGVEPLVERLVQNGANVNTTNSFGYSPLLDACHRGFLKIVGFLIKGGADLRYIPSDEDSASSPFVSAPAQCALAEAARCGFHQIVQLLIDSGASKDQCNSLGWTALHEACFYNRIETVKTLLLAGVNAGARTRKGALPYHLAGLTMIRTMLQDIGGPDAVPETGDEIDMVSVLRELTQSEAILFAGPDGTLQVIRPDEDSSSSALASSSASFMESPAIVTGSKNTFSPVGKIGNGGGGGVSPVLAGPKSSPSHKSPAEKSFSSDNNNNEQQEKLLHSGAMLGDLPSLNINRNSPGKIQFDASLNKALENPDQKKISTKADEKNMKQKKKKVKADLVPADMPTEFLCQLSQRPMSDPVKSIYGHVYDNGTIMKWFRKQGRICPLSGAPLSETDLQPLEDLGGKIRQWIVNKGSKNENENIESEVISDSKVGSSIEVSSSQIKKTAGLDEDLYDF